MARLSSNVFSPSSLTFLFLNILRLLSVLTLFMVMVSQLVVMVEDGQEFGDPEVHEIADQEECTYFPGTEIPTHTWGVFWSQLHRTFVLIGLLLVIMAEVNWGGRCERLFRLCVPPLSNEWGLFPIGVAQIVIATSVLSHFMDGFALVVAWMLFWVGCTYLLIALALRKKNTKDLRSIFASKRKAAWQDKDYVYRCDKLSNRSNSGRKDYGSLNTASKTLSKLKNVVTARRFALKQPSWKLAGTNKKSRVSIHESFPALESDSHRELLRQKAREANARAEMEQENEEHLRPNSVIVEIESGTNSISRDFAWHESSQLVAERSRTPESLQQRSDDQSSVVSSQVRIGGYSTVRARRRTNSLSSSIASESRYASPKQVGLQQQQGGNVTGKAISNVKRRSVAFARSARSRLSGGITLSHAAISRGKKGIPPNPYQSKPSIISIQTDDGPLAALPTLPPAAAYRPCDPRVDAPELTAMSSGGHFGLPVASRFTTV